MDRPRVFSFALPDDFARENEEINAMFYGDGK